MANRVEIIVTADARGAEQEFRRLSGSIDNVNRSAGLFGSVLQGNLASSAIQTALRATIGLLSDAVDEYRKLADAQVFLANASKQARVSLAGQREAVEQLRGELGLARAEASAALAQGTRILGAGRAGESPELVRAMADALAAAGRPASELAARFQQLATGQDELFDIIGSRAGGATSPEQLYKAWAKEAGRTVDSLTDVEKAQIRINEVIAIGERNLGAANERTKTAIGQFDQLQTKIADLKATIGEGFLGSQEVRDFITGMNIAIAQAERLRELVQGAPGEKTVFEQAADYTLFRFIRRNFNPFGGAQGGFAEQEIGGTLTRGGGRSIGEAKGGIKDLSKLLQQATDEYFATTRRFRGEENPLLRPFLELEANRERIIKTYHSLGDEYVNAMLGAAERAGAFGMAGALAGSVGRTTSLYERQEALRLGRGLTTEEAIASALGSSLAVRRVVGQLRGADYGERFGDEELLRGLGRFAPEDFAYSPNAQREYDAALSRSITRELDDRVKGLEAWNATATNTKDTVTAVEGLTKVMEALGEPGSTKASGKVTADINIRATPPVVVDARVVGLPGTLTHALLNPFVSRFFGTTN